MSRASLIPRVAYGRTSARPLHFARDHAAVNCRAFSGARTAPRSKSFFSGLRSKLALAVLGSTAIVAASSALADAKNPEDAKTPPVSEEYHECSEPRPPGDKIEGRFTVPVVADSIDDIVFDQDKDVFLLVWAPGCETCAMMKTVVEHVAEALSSNPDVVIASMNGYKNRKKGFLTEQEEKYSPLMKIYPAKNKQKTAEWPGKDAVAPFDAQGLLRFLRKHVTNKAKVDWSQAEAKVRELADKYEALLRQEATRQLRGFIEENTEAIITSKAPCGDLFQEAMLQFTYGKYTSRLTPEEVEKVFDQMHVCREEKKHELVDYFKKVRDFSQKMLDGYEAALLEAAQEEQQRPSKEAPAAAGAPDGAASTAPSDSSAVAPTATTAPSALAAGSDAAQSQSSKLTAEEKAQKRAAKAARKAARRKANAASEDLSATSEVNAEDSGL